MSYRPLWNQNPAGNFFPLPNALFQLGLLPGEIAVYAYLMYREDRQTYQCHPSYTTIGRAINMSPNTVRKYVRGLEEKNLIYTEPTTIITKKGEKRNGSLLYTIRPIQNAIDLMRQKEREKIELELARLKLEKRRVSWGRFSSRRKEGGLRPLSGSQSRAMPASFDRKISRITGKTEKIRTISDVPTGNHPDCVFCALGGYQRQNSLRFQGFLQGARVDFCWLLALAICAWLWYVL